MRVSDLNETKLSDDGKLGKYVRQYEFTKEEEEAVIIALHHYKHVIDSYTEEYGEIGGYGKSEFSKLLDYMVGVCEQYIGNGG